MFFLLESVLFSIIKLMGSSLSEYKDLYVDTARGYIQSAQKSISTLRSNPKDPQALEDLYLSCHSLKSQSHAVGYNSNATFCMKVEKVIKQKIDAQESLEDDFLDFLDSSHERLSKSIDSIAEDGGEIDMSELIDKVGEYEKK